MQKTAPVNCPKSAICALYNDKILKGNGNNNVYKLIYCTTCRFKNCKRYHTYRMAGQCPDFIMPNSKHGSDYILRKIEEEIPTEAFPGLAGE